MLDNYEYAGFVKFDNYLEDKVIPLLKPVEQCLYRRIYRLTVGFSKKSVKVALKKLAEAVNVSIRTLSTALKKLQELGLISRNREEGEKWFIEILLPEEFQKSNKVDVTAEKVAAPHAKSAGGPAKIAGHIKDNNLKENKLNDVSEELISELKKIKLSQKQIETILAIGKDEKTIFLWIEYFNFMKEKLTIVNNAAYFYSIVVSNKLFPKPDGFKSECEKEAEQLEIIESKVNLQIAKQIENEMCYIPEEDLRSLLRDFELIDDIKSDENVIKSKLFKEIKKRVNLTKFIENGYSLGCLDINHYRWSA